MNEFKIKLKVEGLAELTEALNRLAGQAPVPQQPVTSIPAQSAYVTLESPAAGQPSVPVALPMPVQSGMSQDQQFQQAVPVVPTTANVQEYSLEQLQVAAAGLMTTGKGPQIISILQHFGIQAMTELPKERYGEFATILRGAGAKI